VGILDHSRHGAQQAKQRTECHEGLDHREATVELDLHLGDEEPADLVGIPGRAVVTRLPRIQDPLTLHRVHAPKVPEALEDERPHGERRQPDQEEDRAARLEEAPNGGDDLSRLH
jgi:hypothetical protein